jgi:predicted TIM-barrel fold metal-dependent hydrolase
MIVDAHAHLGWDQVFDEDFTLEEQLQKHEEFGIQTTILQPASCHGIETVREQHDRIAAVAARHPGRFYGMANPNPHLSDSVYEAEVRRCVEKLGFVGLKLHTFAHAVHPGSRDGRKVFGLARELGVPVMVHTGAGIPFANPTNLIAVARDFPEVDIVMAHCGMMIMAGETAIAMEACPNLYADITWTAGFNLRHWARDFGANRFLFGTDHADNTGTELAKVRTCGLSAEEQEWVLHRSAMAVYHFQLGDVDKR